MSAPPTPPQPGPIAKSLSEIAQHLRVDAKAAAAKANEFLKQYPGQRQALALLVSAHRLAGDIAGARTALLQMAEAQPGLAAVHYELGLLLNEAGEHENAIAALSRAITLEPRYVQAWRALGDALAEAGDAAEANKAYARRIQFTAARLKRLENAVSGEHGGLSRAEQMLRARLARDPTDISALVLLGRVYIRLGRHAEARKPVLRALELVPEFAPAQELAALSPSTFNAAAGDDTAPRRL
jgi:Flp pilus assembly protein TadD